MNHTDRSFIFVIWYRWNLPPVCFKQILKSCCETKSLLSTSALRSDLLSVPKLHRAHLICIDSVPAIFPSCENNEMVSPKITNGCRQIEEILLSNENPTVQMVRTLCLLLDKKNKKKNRPFLWIPLILIAWVECFPWFLILLFTNPELCIL